MATKAQLKAQSKYDKQHTRQIIFKLNRNSDADILAKLDDVENRQGYIKTLIRQDIRGNDAVLSIKSMRYMIKPLAMKHNIKSVYLFGSYARGEATKDSDVDIMIESNMQSAEEYFSVLEELESLFGKKVDLTMHEAAAANTSRANKRFLEHFEKEKVVLYE